MRSTRVRRILSGTLVYAGIVILTLVLVDLFCMAFGLFPPPHDFGDPDLGWRSAPATGRMAIGVCHEFSTGETIRYERNEDGVRTGLSRTQIKADSGRVKIAVTGDSQTDLCTPNSQLHSGVLESELTLHGVPATALTYGAGKYSPLQAYLAFRLVLRPYRPDVLVMNLYTGNDFYDILRVDDRPHFVATGTGYRIAKPVWFSLDDPGIRRRSRVLFAFRTLADKAGVRRLFLRGLELRRLGAQQGGGLPDVIAYMRDLWGARDQSVGYADAFAAQILNQQLFFQRFPPGLEESLRRVRALMVLIRAENPGLVMVMSPLPSYQLVEQQPVDGALLRTLERLPISYQAGIRQEGGLYERLRELATEQGWLFVDNLAVLRAYRGTERLYNDFDYHLLPLASALIGRAQATALLDPLRQSSH